METGEQPLVSVVLITRDRPAKLEGALASLRDQSYPALELVVVDGSQESVEPLVRRHAGDLPVTYCRDDGTGAGAARNVGMRAATGTYVAFLDDDDRWLPRKVERQVETFAPDVGTVYTGQFTVRDGERVGGRTPSLSGWVTEELLRGTACSPTSTIMVRRTLIEETGGFDERFPVWEDREWYVRLSQHGTFQPVPAQLVHRGLGDYDQLTDDFEAVRDVAYPLFLEKHRKLAADYGRSCERALVASLSRMAASSGIAAGRYAEARRYILRSLRHDPFQQLTWLYLLVSLGGQPVHGAARRLQRVSRTLTDWTPSEG
jgi:glycosyltransferase involved in cell wall biosynthesis